jgi:hypothetical protein
VVLDVGGSNPLTHPKENAGQEPRSGSQPGLLTLQCPILGVSWEPILAHSAKRHIMQELKLLDKRAATLGAFTTLLDGVWAVDRIGDVQPEQVQSRVVHRSEVPAISAADVQAMAKVPGLSGGNDVCGEPDRWLFLVATRCILGVPGGRCASAHSLKFAADRYSRARSMGLTVPPTSVPDRAETCCRQRSPTGTGNGLRRGHAQVDPLPETTCDETPCLAGDCVESSQVSSAGPTRAMPL